MRHYTLICKQLLLICTQGSAYVTLSSGQNLHINELPCIIIHIGSQEVVTTDQFGAITHSFVSLMIDHSNLCTQN